VADQSVVYQDWKPSDLEVESVLEVNGRHQGEDQQFLRCSLLALGEKGFTGDSGMGVSITSYFEGLWSC
jgi:hypothetical protein